MKLAAIFFALLGLACAAPAQQYNLRNDLDDFIALIPTEKLVALYHKYENDPDIKKIIAYVKSDDFKKVVHIVVGVPEVRNIVDFIEAKGVPIKELLNKLADKLGLPHWPGSYSLAAVHSTRSVKDFLKEALALIPVDEITSLALDKLANSPDFGELYEMIASVDYQRLEDQALSHPEIRDLISRAEALGIDVKKIWETVKSIFGWE